MAIEKKEQRQSESDCDDSFPFVDPYSFSHGFACMSLTDSVVKCVYLFFVFCFSIDLSTFACKNTYLRPKTLLSVMANEEKRLKQYHSDQRAPPKVPDKMWEECREPA